MDGKRLLAFRQELGLNQAQLGEIFGYGQSAIARMEAGERPVPAAIQRGRSQALRWIDAQKKRETQIVIKYMTGERL